MLSSIPIVQGRKKSLAKYVRGNKQDLIRQCFLTGAILFRNYDVNVDKFEHVVDGFGMGNMNMIGSAAPRTKISETIYTANDSPPTEIIPMHHEMAQTSNPPSHIFFLCDTPAQKGGSTPLLDSRSVARFLQRQFPKASTRLKRGVYYQRVMGAEDDASSAIGRGWKSTFMCSSASELEAFLKSSRITFEWLDEERELIRTRTPLMPVFQTVGTQTVFFNSVIAVYNGWNDARNVGSECILDADGDFLDAGLMHELNEFVKLQQIEFEWQKNDLLMIDNRVMMHSRSTFVPPRKLYATIRRYHSSPM